MMKKIILSFAFIVVFAIGIAMAETAPTPCPEQQQVAKVVRGPAGPRGPQGLQGLAGQPGPQGEIPWWLLVLSGVAGGLFGGVIVLALNQPAQPAPAPAQQVPPVNIFNNVVPAGGQPQPPQPPPQQQ